MNGFDDVRTILMIFFCSFDEVDERSIFGWTLKHTDSQSIVAVLPDYAEESAWRC